MEPLHYALLAFLGWGFCDFLVFLLAKRIHQRVALFFVHLYGTVGLAGYSVLLGSFPQLSVSVVLSLLASSILYCVAWLAYFRALREGVLSVVSPVTASYGIVSAVIGYVYFQDRLSSPQLAAVASAVVGLILVSVDIRELLTSSSIRGLSKGLPFAVLAMLGWGILPVFWRSSVLHIGSVHTVLITKLFTITILGVWALFDRRPFAVKVTIPSQWLLLGAGVLDAVALIAYNSGIAINTTLVAPIASSYTVLSVLLALTFLGERLRGLQWLGVGLVIGALVALSLL